MTREDLIKETIELRESRPDLTWREISDILNNKYNLKHDTSTYNRWYNGSQNTISRVFVERKRSTMIRSELHKVAKDLAIKEQVVDKIHEIMELPKIKVRTKSVPKGNEIIEYVISDLHYRGGVEEIAHAENIFSTIVASIRENQNPKAEYRITFLGDDIEGMGAHESQLLTNQEVATKQMLELSAIYIQGLEAIFKEVPTKAKKSVVFVPYSNHGLAYGTHKGRYQFPTNDYGVIMLSIIQSGLRKDVYIYEPDSSRFVVETKDTIYSHGHQGFHKSKTALYETLGVDKDIYQGHLHHIEMVEERNRKIVKFPTCRLKYIDYEKMAGYKPVPQISLVRRSETKTLFDFIKII